jgi:hypothetical protein
MKQRLVFLKEVEHSVRYAAADKKADNLVSSIYILKSGLKKPYPIVVDLTIEEVKE